MMFVQLPVGSIFATGCGGVGGGLLALPCLSLLRNRRRVRLIKLPVVMALGDHAHGGLDDHYTVLGVSRCATYDDIKKAYRLLARKWHPDVNKDLHAGEVFKSVRLAYEVLSNEAKRIEYDHKLGSCEGFSGLNRSTYYNSHHDQVPDLDYVLRIYRWNGLSKKKQKQRYWNKYNNSRKSSFFYADEEFADKTSFVKRGSFTRVLESAFVSLFLMQTMGCRLSLTFSSIVALVDEKLDGGYKLGYIMAWILGGKGGILLTLFLSFASWAFGKTSSGTVAVVLVAMWIGSSLAIYCPIPQGAVLALMYMSIKLQADLN